MAEHAAVNRRGTFATAAGGGCRERKGVAPKGESRSAERVRRPFGNSASVRARQGEPLKRDTEKSVSLFLPFFGFNACSCVSSTAFGCYLLRSPCGCHRQAYLSSVKSAETDKDVGDVDGSSWWAFRPPLCVLLCFSARAWLAEMLPIDDMEK